MYHNFPPIQKDVMVAFSFFAAISKSTMDFPVEICQTYFSNQFGQYLGE